MSNINDLRFPKSVRLRRQYEFDRVHSGNYFAADQNLVVKAVPNETNETRLGLSVSKKVGNAVVRNKWKRTIREVFRKNRHDMQVGLDIVVRPKKGATCSYAKIANSMPKLLERLKRNIERDQKRGIKG